MADLWPSRYDGVLTDRRDYFTPNLVRGARVYGEKLVTFEGREFRRWDPHRSKLAALLQKGCPIWPFRQDTETLYIGAASGTTASHVSDVCATGRLFCIEISPRVFRKLLDVSSTRSNMMPFLGDADHPETYRNLAGQVDVVYQDVAQRNQVSIFSKNLDFLRKGGHGLLMVKARSIDVAVGPDEIYRRVSSDLSTRGLDVLATIKLDPFEKDHAAVIVKKVLGKLK